MIEYRLLTEEDIPSLLELYVQLDEVNRGYDGSNLLSC